jgi:hypothetical protein
MVAPPVAPSLLRFVLTDLFFSFRIVARIAYLSSDVVVSVQAAQSIESEFSSHLRNYAANKVKSVVAAAESGVPEVYQQIPI